MHAERKNNTRHEFEWNARDGVGGRMTMADEARSRLGRGLAALIGDMGSETQVIDRGRGQRRVPIEFLKPNPKNPRRSFSEAELDELAASIKERGIIQPIVVRPAKGPANASETIAGGRRWRATRAADRRGRTV